MEIPKTAIDLFCGCGGISAGLEMANYRILSGLDVERKYISSFIRNFPDSTVLTDDITNMPPEEFCEKINFDHKNLGILVGGPPCQGFSKNVPRKNRFLEDPKNLLVNHFLEYAIFFQPPIIIMENVAEMKNGFNHHFSDEIVSRLSSAGYSVTKCVLNAADYGVPQRRKRAFFLANKYGYEFAPPAATHSPSSSLFNEKYVSVWDAIGDLPSLNHGEGKEISEYACAPFSDYQRNMRNSDNKVKNHIARKLRPTQFSRLSSIEPGQGVKDLPQHLRIKGGYSGAYGRLTKDMVAPTITRWVFHPGSGRWGHPVDVRTLTMRETARIQGFPDSHEFIGSYNEQAGQLGNAVPPLLIHELIKSLEFQLESHFKPSSKFARTSHDIRASLLGRKNDKACAVSGPGHHSLSPVK